MLMPSKEELKKEVHDLKVCFKIVEKQRNEIDKKSANQSLELEKYRNFFKLLKEILKEI